ncbi:thiamine pyrophosphate-binding protein [Streptomyces sp. NPDC055239]
MTPPTSQAQQLTGAEVVLRVLHNEGVRHVFGNPGTTELPLMRQLAEHHDIEYVLALQEASAVAMADGHARVTGRPAFVNLHAAAGLGNGVGALTNAAAAGVPLVVTAGQQDQRHLIHDPVLAGDLAGLSAPTVKWAHEVATREELGEALLRAFRLAQAPPTGPVFLSLPMNLLEETGPPPPRPTQVQFAAAAPIDNVAKRLNDAPAEDIALIFCDELAREAPDEGVALAEALGAPVWGSGWPATNPFPTAHPLWQGYLPPHALGIRDSLASYRLILIAGAHALPRYFPYAPGPLLNQDAHIIQITADPGEPGRDTPVAQALHGQLQPTLQRLLECLPSADRTTWNPRIPALPAHAGPLDLPSLGAGLATALPAGTLVVDEAPQASRHIRAALQLRKANQYQWVSGGLGWAMPAAIGVSLASDRGQVMCTVGDGAAMYSPQALWTAARLNLPIGFVVADNREYSILKDNWRLSEPNPEKFIGMDLAQPAVDFVALAESMGVHGRRVTTSGQLSEAVADGYRTPGPFLIAAELANA